MSENITPSPDPNENSMQRLRRFVARHRKWLTGLGFVALLLLVVLYIREFISGTIFTRYAIIACIFLVLAFLLDEDEGGVSEKTDTGETPKKKVNWWHELRGLGLMLLGVLAFHSLIAKPFYIPSASMVPNLMVGDRLVVSKYPYGWSWVSASFHVLPRGPWRIAPDTPEYGDIVIAVPPDRDEDYIKRVVALPGDRIAMVNGQIILNGEPVPQEVEPRVQIPVDAQICDGRPCLDPFEPYLVRLADGRQVYEPPTLRETLPNGASYVIIDHRTDNPLDNFDEIVVPEDSVFLMGDNRDHSADSRAPAGPFGNGLGGPVPIANIGGRAEFITFSLDGSTTWNPLTWIEALRPERAWRSLRPQLRERTGGNGAD